MKADVSILRQKFEPVVTMVDGAEALIGHKVYNQDTLLDTTLVHVKRRTHNGSPNGFKTTHAEAVLPLKPAGSHVNGYVQGDKKKKGLWTPSAFVCA